MLSQPSVDWRKKAFLSSVLAGVLASVLGGPPGSSNAAPTETFCAEANAAPSATDYEDDVTAFFESGMRKQRLAFPVVVAALLVALFATGVMTGRSRLGRIRRHR